MRVEIRKRVFVFHRQANGKTAQRVFDPLDGGSAFLVDGALYEMDAQGDLRFFIAAHHLVAVSSEDAASTMPGMDRS